jgi:D-alanyl-D-alanine dipeptidase
VDELLHRARQASPPPEPGKFLPADLVDLASFDSTLRFDVRYATPDNFLGSALYPSPSAVLQRPAAEALVRAHRRLHRSGYGLLIHDGYRPWYVTKVFWDATPAAQRWLVADPARGSRHNRGAAVDVSLYELATGAVADMGGTYDEPTARSSTFYPVATGVQFWHRELLREALEAEGFTQLAEEWWHFDYQDWRRYPILNVPLEALAPGSAPAR